MAVWSSLAFCNIGKTALLKSTLTPKNGFDSKCLNYIPVRNSGHGNTFVIKPSKFRYLKLLDVAHFYFLLGAIPVGALILYCNIFIGPAKLAEIPQDYVPKHWEYYEHPITRWIAKLLPSPQEGYEKDLHKINEKALRYQIRNLEKKIEEYMKEKEDYQAWYFVETGAKYTRKAHEHGVYVEKESGKALGIDLDEYSFCSNSASLGHSIGIVPLTVLLKKYLGEFITTCGSVNVKVM